jgi:hypothetical protein
MKVIGIGEQKTPNSFIVACDRFVYIEVLGGAIKRKEPKECKLILKKKPSPKSLNKVDPNYRIN